MEYSELHPVNEVNTKGQFFRASFGKNPRFQIQLDKRPLSPGTDSFYTFPAPDLESLISSRISGVFLEPLAFRKQYMDTRRVTDTGLIIVSKPFW